MLQINVNEQIVVFFKTPNIKLIIYMDLHITHAYTSFIGEKLGNTEVVAYTHS